MKRKLTFVTGIFVLMSLLVMTSASAFSVGNVDGIWGMIDRGAGGSLIDLVGIIGQDPGTYWDGGGNLRTENRTLVRQSTVCGPDMDGSATLVGWTGYPDQTYTYLNAHSIDAGCAPTELFFSEYIETNKGRRALEIYNGTGTTVDLSAYTILIFGGGSSTETSTVDLSGSLASGSTWVVANGAITGHTINQTETLGFGGDDAVGLFKNYTADTDGEADDAYCSRWGTGPGQSPTTTSDYWWMQNPPNTDENQVRYGRDAYNGPNWQSRSCADTTWDQQSGFGFDGVNGPVTPTPKTPFFLGKFVHYNNQVYSSDDNGNGSYPLAYVDLIVTIPFTCNDGTTTNFVFEPRITLDETSNSEGTCVYPDPPEVPGSVPCPDKVTITEPITTASFTCPNEGTYTVNLNGFTKGATCDTVWNPDAVATEYITQEEATNQACLWATIDQPIADIAAAKTCQNFDDSTTLNEFYRIVITNAGPGAARQPELVDTLPVGANYSTAGGRTWTSTLTTTSGTVNQGSCTIVGKVVTCRLLTPLPDWDSDNLAKWTVEIPVDLVAGSKVNTVTATSGTTDTNMTNNTATANCDSTAVSLISFTAETAESGVLLKWETASELDNLGFNIFRADDPEAEKVRVNPAMILSKAMGSTSGAFYEFLDEDVETGKMYYYWLEAVDFALTKTLYGPISVE